MNEFNCFDEVNLNDQDYKDIIKESFKEIFE